MLVSFRTNYQSRVYVVLVTSASTVYTQTVDSSNTNSFPNASSLVPQQCAELGDSTNLTIQKGTGISILLSRDECRIFECIQHVTELVLRIYRQ